LITFISCAARTPHWTSFAANANAKHRLTASAAALARPPRTGARTPSVLATCAADAQVSEGEIVERAVRAMDLRALVAQIRVRSKLDEGDAMALVQEELRAARAEHAA
jgi:hypothetical protein